MFELNLSMHERLPFFYYCGKISHQIRFCEFANDACIDFWGKYASYREWLGLDMNMKVPMHVKQWCLKKKTIDGSMFGSSSISVKKVIGKAIRRGKENNIASCEKDKRVGKVSDDFLC